MYASGAHGRAELATAVIPKSRIGPLYAEVTFWINIFNTTPIATYPVASSAYEVEIDSVSAVDGSVFRIGGLSNQHVYGMGQWQEFVVPFCLSEDSLLKFVVVRSPFELGFAIDEVRTTGPSHCEKRPETEILNVFVLVFCRQRSHITLLSVL